MNIKGQDHYLTFAKGHSVFKLKSCFFSKTVELFETKYHVKASGSSERINLYNWVWSYDQDDRLKKLIFDIVLCIVT